MTRLSTCPRRPERYEILRKRKRSVRHIHKSVLACWLPYGEGIKVHTMEHVNVGRMEPQILRRFNKAFSVGILIGIIFVMVQQT